MLLFPLQAAVTRLSYMVLRITFFMRILSKFGLKIQELMILLR